MLKNIYLKTLRDARLGILLWGSVLALIFGAGAATYPDLLNGPNKAAQLKDIQELASSFSFLFGKAYDLDTVGGFITFRYMSTFVVILAIYALLVGSSLIRGEEERGQLDLLLSMPHSRRSVLLQKWAGFVTALVSITAMCALALIGANASAKLDMEAGPVVVALLNIVLLALFFGNLALGLGQMMTRRGAASWTGGALAATYLLNSVAGNASSLEWLKYISPFYYYNLSKPLARSVGTNWGALAILAVAGMGLLLAALAMFQQRDTNSYFRLFGSQYDRPLSPEKRLAEPKSPWLSGNFGLGFRAALPGALIWGAGMGAYVVLILSVYNEIKDSMFRLLTSTDLIKNFGFVITPSNESLLSLLLLSTMVLIYTAYAVTVISGWTSEENEGRLELVLSTPIPRWRLLLSRFAVAALATLITLVIVGLVLVEMLQLGGIPVDMGRLAGTFFGMWVLALIINAAGFLLAAFRPNPAVAVAGAIVGLSYLLDVFAELLKLPGWLVNFSIFHQYGQPLATGVNWTPLWGMLGLSVAFVAVAVFRFQQRDIVK